MIRLQMIELNKIYITQTELLMLQLCLQESVASLRHESQPLD